MNASERKPDLVQHRVIFYDNSQTEWLEGDGEGMYPETPILSVEVRELYTGAPAPVKVKTLDWHKSHMSAWNGDYHTVPTAYTVRLADENGWKWSGFGGHGYENSPEAAKAAAQADYEARVLSAIELVPVKAQDDLVEDALRTLLHAVCGETGFANAVRNESGHAYPWPSLDVAEAKAFHALRTAPASLDAEFIAKAANAPEPAFSALRDAYVALAFAFNRLSSSARSRDGELCRDFEKVRGKIEAVFRDAGEKL